MVIIIIIILLFFFFANQTETCIPDRDPDRWGPPAACRTPRGSGRWWWASVGPRGARSWCVPPEPSEPPGVTCWAGYWHHCCNTHKSNWSTGKLMKTNKLLALLSQTLTLFWIETAVLHPKCVIYNWYIQSTVQGKLIINNVKSPPVALCKLTHLWEPLIVVSVAIDSIYQNQLF